MTDDIKILATGNLLLGTLGVRTIGKVLLEMMRETKQELLIAAYRFTCSLPELRDGLESVLARGCNVQMILDAAECENDMASEGYLSGLLQSSPNLQIWDFIGSKVQAGNETYVARLHAKVVLMDRKKAVVGSANFSRNGLMENHELAVQFSGKPVVGLARSIDKFLTRGRASGALRLRTRHD